MKNYPNIYVRGSIYWCKIKLHGKWVPKSTGIRTDARRGIEYAEDFRLMAQEQADNGGRLPSNTTVATFAKKWGEDRKADDRQRLDKWVLPKLGHRMLRQLSSQDVSSWLRWLVVQELSPKSMHNVYATIRAMFTEVVALDLVTINPFGNEKRRALYSKILPQIESAEREPFDKAEILRLMGPGLPMRRRVINALGGLLGLRAGEISALRWSAIAPQEPLHELKIVGAFNTRERDHKGTKTGAKRTLPLPDELTQLLTVWRLEWAKLQDRVPTDRDFVVFGKRAANLRADSNNREFVEDMAAVKVEARGRTFHCTRHSFVTQMGRANVGGVEKAWLKDGRSLGRDSMGLYTHPPWEDLCEAMSQTWGELQQVEAEVIELQAVVGSQMVQHGTVTASNGEKPGPKTPQVADKWRARHDSNMRPTGSKPSEKAQRVANSASAGVVVPHCTMPSFETLDAVGFFVAAALEGDYPEETKQHFRQYLEWVHRSAR